MEKSSQLVVQAEYRYSWISHIRKLETKRPTPGKTSFNSGHHVILQIETRGHQHRRRARRCKHRARALHGPANEDLHCTARSGKLYRARSRLDRSRILQVNTYLILFESFWRHLQDLHAFAPLSIQDFSQISLNFFSHFHCFFTTIFSKTLSKVHEFWWRFSGISAFSAGKIMSHLLDSTISWDFVV